MVLRTGILFVIILMSFHAQAEISYSMPAIELGMKINSVDHEQAVSNKQTNAYQGGLSVVINLSNDSNADFGIRTGLFYSERSFKNDLSNGLEIQGKITYVELPLHLMFKFEDYAGVYIGPAYAVQIGDECNGLGCGSGLTDIKSSLVPITFGAEFKLFSNLGLNLFFENVSGGIAQSLKNSRAIGLNIMIITD